MGLRNNFFFFFSSTLESHNQFFCFIKLTKRNRPYRLPEDFKSFFSIMNGMQIKWKVIFKGKKFTPKFFLLRIAIKIAISFYFSSFFFFFKEENYPLGFMHINRLQEIIPINSDGLLSAYRSIQSDHGFAEPMEELISAFCIDNRCRCGKVALSYLRGVLHFHIHLPNSNLVFVSM